MVVNLVESTSPFKSYGFGCVNLHPLHYDVSSILWDPDHFELRYSTVVDVDEDVAMAEVVRKLDLPVWRCRLTSG